jgi:hypothetical protein
MKALKLTSALIIIGYKEVDSKISFSFVDAAVI